LPVDVGVGDAAWPPPESRFYPALLDLPTAPVLAYGPEAVVAEKLEAMVVLGQRNSRIRDFFDVHHLAEHRGFEGAILLESIRRTFERRGTPIPTEEPIALTSAYWDDPAREVQIRAFARRSGIRVSPDVARDVLRVRRTPAGRLKSVWGFRRNVRCLPMESMTVSFLSSFVLRRPRPNGWRHRIRDSVGRSMRTVSSSGRSRPSLKTSTAQMTSSLPSFSSSSDCARGAEAAPVGGAG
jgi:hypothetical protein